MAEQVYAADLKSAAERIGGSNPLPSTLDQWCSGSILVSKTKGCGPIPRWSVLLFLDEYRSGHNGVVLKTNVSRKRPAGSNPASSAI